MIYFYSEIMNIMKENIHLFNWQVDIKKEEVTSIGNDLILLDKPIIKPRFDHPFKVDATTAQICLSGKSEGFINLKEHISEGPCLTIILPGQILQHKYMSEDFSGLYIVMSQRFINNLNIQPNSTLFHSISDNPTVALSDKGLRSVTFFYVMLKEAIQNIDNPYRMETVRHLTKAFFYGSGYSFHKIPEDKNKSKYEILVNKFLDLVKEHYRQERGIGFYAGKLCLTPKYLSTVIKENSNQSANDWIDRYVILEAQALLKSTNMTIQQISDELNFPSQSFFGKYFKRLTSMSPREYKNK